MNRLYTYGMTTTSGGNLSICDEDGVIWITPGGTDKGNLKVEDIVKIMPDGTCEGKYRPSMEYPFHTAIYKTRHDVKAVLHAHSPSLVAFGITHKIPDINLIPQAKPLINQVGYVPYNVPGSEELSRDICGVFEMGIDTVMLENHGAVVGAKNLFSAFMKFEMLDYCAKMEINAKTISNKITQINEKHMALYRLKACSLMSDFIPESVPESEQQIRKEMCDFIKRAYDGGLFTSCQGTFSCRLNNDSFLITPYKLDRKYLEPDDLIKVEDGKKERGKTPSRSADLHLNIYKNSPEINSVIIAQPPHIMAFAVTEPEFDSEIMPETYVMLRNIKKYPFGSSFMQPELMSQELTLTNPTCIVENDCVISCGKSLLNAYDRLEVMEYSAKSVIGAIQMREKIFKMNSEEIDKVKEVFKLD